MAGITPRFNRNQIVGIVNQFQETIDAKIISSLQYLGEEFVNKARSNDTYTDRTANLRGSIGYIVLAQGKVIQSDFKGKVEGKSKGEKFAKELGARYPKGYALIGVAGMHYAAAVEANGYDVITASSPTREMLIELIREE